MTDTYTKKSTIRRGNNYLNFLYDDNPTTRVGVEFVDISPHTPLSGNQMQILLDKTVLKLTEGMIHIYSREQARKIYRCCLTDGFERV